MLNSGRLCQACGQNVSEFGLREYLFCQSMEANRADQQVPPLLQSGSVTPADRLHEILLGTDVVGPWVTLLDHTVCHMSQLSKVAVGVLI